MSMPLVTSIESAAGVWDYVSPSRLNLWLRCPLAFKFRYIDGIRTPTTSSLFVGKAVHAGLECFYRHRQMGVELQADQVIAQMNECWASLVSEEDMQFESVDEEVQLKSQTRDLVGVYLKQISPDEGRPIAVETKLQVPLVDPMTGEDLGIPMLGVVDLVLGGNEGPIICDFKTSSKSNNPVEILHEVQLTSYAYLFRQMANEPEAGLEIRSLIKTKSPKLECHHYAARSDAHFRRFFQLVRAYLDDLDGGRFVYRPGWSCSMCDYRDGSCGSWAGY